jgi:hypothetical protein
MYDRDGPVASLNRNFFLGRADQNEPAKELLRQARRDRCLQPLPPCRAPAVRGWQVCRMHGARGGAPEGERNGNYRHGARSKETIELRKLIKSLR